MSTEHSPLETVTEEGSLPIEEIAEREAEAEPLSDAAFLVSDIMSTDVHHCSIGDTLDRPAQLMWDHDCGAIPVLDEGGHTVAMITDRDICMAAYIQGRPLHQIAVSSAASRHVVSIHPDAPLDQAHHLMTMHRVRRLPVIDAGGNLVGVLSLADVVCHADRSLAPRHPLHVETVLATLADAYRSGARDGDGERH